MLSEELRTRRRRLVRAGRSLSAVLEGILEIVSSGAIPEDMRAVTQASSALVRRSLSRLRDTSYCIGVFGLIRMGKSTLLNAIASQYVSKIDALPTTAAMVQLVDGQGPAMVHFFEALGRSPEAIDPSAESIAEFTTQERNPGNEKGVRVVIVPLRMEFLEEEVVLLDTPGLGDMMRSFSEHSELSLDSEAHAVVLVARYGSVFNQDNIEFLRLALERVPKVIFLVNCDSQATNLSPEGVRSSSEWGEEPRRALRERFERDVVARDRLFAEAFEQRQLELFFVDVLAAASARIRLRRGLAGAQRELAQLELRDSGFEVFFASLSAFIADDERWSREIATRGADLLRAAREVGERLDGLRPSVHERRERNGEECALIEAELERLPGRIAEIRQRIFEAAQDQVAGLRTLFESWTEEFVQQTMRTELEAWLDNADTVAQLEERVQRAARPRIERLEGLLGERREHIAERIRSQAQLLLEAHFRATLEKDPGFALDVGGVGSVDELVAQAVQPVMDGLDHIVKGIGSVVVTLVSAAICGGGGVALIASGPIGLVVGAIVGIAVAAAARLGYDATIKESMEGWVRVQSIPALLKRQVLLREGRREEILREVREDLVRRIAAGVARAETQLDERLAPELAPALEAVREQTRAKLSELVEETRRRNTDLTRALERIDSFALLRAELERAGA